MLKQLKMTEAVLVQDGSYSTISKFPTFYNRIWNITIWFGRFTESASIALW